MIIQEIPIEQLKPYPNNPRNNAAAIDAVARSIQSFGFKVPVVIDSDQVIVCGHTRVKAAEKLGLAKIPCIIADDLTEDQIKAFRLADNKTAELAEWDLEKLEAELKQIEFDMTLFDFKRPEPDLKEDDFDLDTVLGSIEDPITQPGDLWILGRHRLLCGDATSKKDVAKLMAGRSADIVITDPPYNVALGMNETPEEAKKRNRRTDGLVVKNDSMTDAQFLHFLTEADKRLIEAMRPGAPIYIFHADSEGLNFRAAFKAAGFKLSQALVWVKSSLIMGRQDYQGRHEPILYGWKEGAAHYWNGDRNKDTVFEDGRINLTKAKREDLIQTIKDLQAKLYENTTTIYHDKPSRSLDHPTMKPVKLLGRLLANSSERGALLLDTFGGSGSALVAAELADRSAYLMELDPKYCDVIVHRFEELTGEPGERISDGQI